MVLKSIRVSSQFSLQIIQWIQQPQPCMCHHLPPPKMRPNCLSWFRKPICYSYFIAINPSSFLVITQFAHSTWARLGWIFASTRSTGGLGFFQEPEEEAEVVLCDGAVRYQMITRCGSRWSFGRWPAVFCLVEMDTNDTWFSMARIKYHLWYLQAPIADHRYHLQGETLGCSLGVLPPACGSFAREISSRTYPTCSWKLVFYTSSSACASAPEAFFSCFFWLAISPIVSPWQLMLSDQAASYVFDD